MVRLPVLFLALSPALPVALKTDQRQFPMMGADSLPAGMTMETLVANMTALVDALKDKKAQKVANTFIAEFEKDFNTMLDANDHQHALVRAASEATDQDGLVPSMRLYLETQLNGTEDFVLKYVKAFQKDILPKLPNETQTSLEPQLMMATVGMPAMLMLQRSKISNLSNENMPEVCSMFAPLEDKKQGIPVGYKNLTMKISQVNASKSFLPMLLPMACAKEPQMTETMQTLSNLYIDSFDRMGRRLQQDFKSYLDNVEPTVLKKIKCTFSKATSAGTGRVLLALAMMAWAWRPL